MRFHPGPFVPLNETQASRELRMHFVEQVRTMVHQRSNAARLCAGEEVARHAARGQHQWVFGIGLLNGRGVFDPHVGVRLAIREVKWPLTLRHRVPGILLEQAWCTGMVCGAVRPEHAVLALDLLIGDPVIVGDAALRGGRSSSRMAPGEAKVKPCGRCNACAYPG